TSRLPAPVLPYLCLSRAPKSLPGAFRHAPRPRWRASKAECWAPLESDQLNTATWYWRENSRAQESRHAQHTWRSSLLPDPRSSRRPPHRRSPPCRTTLLWRLRRSRCPLPATDLLPVPRAFATALLWRILWHVWRLRSHPLY